MFASEFNKLDTTTFTQDALMRRKGLASMLGVKPQLIALTVEDLLGDDDEFGDDEFGDEFVTVPGRTVPGRTVSERPVSGRPVSGRPVSGRPPLPGDLYNLPLDWKNVGSTGNCLFNSLIGAESRIKKESTEDLPGQYKLRQDLIEGMEGLEGIKEYYQSDMMGMIDDINSVIKGELYNELIEGMEKMKKVKILQAVLGREINNSEDMLKAVQMYGQLIRGRISNVETERRLEAIDREYSRGIQQIKEITDDIEALFVAYKKYMIQDTMYGTDLEIHLAAIHYQRPIIVLRPAVGHILIFRNNPVIIDRLNVWKHTIKISDNPFSLIDGLALPLILGHIQESQHYIYALYDEGEFLRIQRETGAEAAAGATAGAAAGAGEAYASAATGATDASAEPDAEQKLKLSQLNILFPGIEHAEIARILETVSGNMELAGTLLAESDASLGSGATSTGQDAWEELREGFDGETRQMYQFLSDVGITGEPADELVGNNDTLDKLLNVTPEELGIILSDIKDEDRKKIIQKYAKWVEEHSDLYDGGSKRRRSKRKKTQKRKTNKRKTKKRKSTKRKTKKRKTQKRKTQKSKKKSKRR